MRIACRFAYVTSLRLRSTSSIAAGESCSTRGSKLDEGRSGRPRDRGVPQLAPPFQCFLPGSDRVQG